MILAGAEQNCLAEVLILAAALNIQDPRERPRGAEQKADPLHQRFRDERSDFLGLLKLWAFARDAQQKGMSELRRVCQANFLSFVRIREWAEVHRQLEDVARELQIDESRGGAGERATPRKPGDLEPRLHRALLTGLLSKI